MNFEEYMKRYSGSDKPAQLRNTGPVFSRLPRNNEDGGIGFFIAFTVLFLWISWPVCVWLICSTGITVLVLYLLRLVDIGVQGKTGRRSSILLHSGLKSLATSMICVDIGILIVCVIQIILSIYGECIDPETLWSLEKNLDALHRGLQTVMSYPYFLAGLIGAFAMTTAWPHLRALRRYVVLQRHGYRFSVTLLTISSFTFFADTDIHVKENGWLTHRMWDAKYAHERILESQKAAVAVCWTEAAIKAMPVQQLPEIREAIRVARAGENPEEIIRLLGRDVAASVAKPENSEVGRAGSKPRPSASTQEKIDYWLDNQSSEPDFSFEEFERYPSLTERAEKEFRDRHVAAIEAASSLLGQLAGIVNEPLLSTFVSALIETISKEILEVCSPNGVRDYAAARLWVQLWMLTPRYDKSIDRRYGWNWDVRTSEQRNEPSMEKAIALSVNSRWATYRQQKEKEAMMRDADAPYSQESATGLSPFRTERDPRGFEDPTRMRRANEERERVLRNQLERQRREVRRRMEYRPLRGRR